MKQRHLPSGVILKAGSALLLGISMSACATLSGFGGTSWKEEALLHDGSKIVVERSVERGGRHEIGQPPPINEQRLSFSLPGAHQIIKWEDHHSEDLGSANFLPLLVDVVDGIPYVVASPAGCLSYNKWGRPNPPYVVFRFKDKKWARIPLHDLPTVIQRPNLIFSSPDIEAAKIGLRTISAEKIRDILDGYRQPAYRTILREPIKPGAGASSVNCPDYSSPRLMNFKAPNPVLPPATGK